MTLTAIPAPAAGGPPGANGTVKIDGQPFDAGHDNDPHVGCVFQVEFFGFDQGDYQADVTFSVQPPTGQFTVIRQDHVFIGASPAGGGVLDAAQTYDLGPDLVGTPHPQQGYHVKLTVSTSQVGGKVATKQKVFWVQGCTPSGPPTG